MESIILAPAWIHLGLLLTAGILFIATGPGRTPAGTTPIVRGLIWLAILQVLLAISALCITYLDLRSDAGCLIGIAGYGLNALAFLVAASLMAFVVFRYRKLGRQMAARLILFLITEAVLTTEALLIHARSLGYCIGSV